MFTRESISNDILVGREPRERVAKSTNATRCDSERLKSNAFRGSFDEQNVREKIREGRASSLSTGS